MLNVELYDAAGRTAYLASFHAAQAFIFEKASRIFKTHNGVQTEFLRLTKDDPGFTAAQRVVLSQTYNLKAVADIRPVLMPRFRRNRLQMPWKPPKAFLRISPVCSLPSRRIDPAR